MRSLTIQLSEDLARDLANLSQRQHASVEETARGILRRRLLLSRFQELCRESEQLAKAAGFTSEDEILRLVS
jgi:hypothetical protein